MSISVELVEPDEELELDLTHVELELDMELDEELELELEEELEEELLELEELDDSL